MAGATYVKASQQFTVVVAGACNSFLELLKGIDHGAGELHDEHMTRMS